MARGAIRWIQGLIFAAALAVPAMAPPAAAQPAQAAGHADFSALEQHWLDALARHDIPALNRLLAPEFVDTMWNGRLRDKQAVLAQARTAGLRHGTQHLSDLKAVRYGDVAIVSGVNETAQARLRFTDVFVRRAGRWQAVRAQETLVRESDR